MYYPCNHKYSREYNIFKKKMCELVKKQLTRFIHLPLSFGFQELIKLNWHPFRLLYRLIIKLHVKGNFRNIVGIELFKVAFYYQQVLLIYLQYNFFPQPFKDAKVIFERLEFGEHGSLKSDPFYRFDIISSEVVWCQQQ